MRFVIAASLGSSLINFRGDLIREIVSRGHEVYCISCETDEGTKKSIEALGAKYESVPLTRTGTNPLNDIKAFFTYVKVIKKIKPDMFFAYMSKPVAYGMSAARVCRVPHRTVMVTGLEIAFYGKGFKNALIRFVLKTLFRFAHGGCEKIIFQNGDDLAAFKKMHLVKEKQIATVHGSGVNMTRFYKAPLPEKAVFLMVARLVWSKGIREYIEAAKKLKNKGVEAEFRIVGPLDSNQESLSKEELDSLVKDGTINYIGPSNNVPKEMAEASVYVLPSYHEGIPRSVLEAMSMGRAVITTNAPGCRETAEDGKSGFIVPIKDIDALAEKMELLATDRNLRSKMGENAHALCSEIFDVKKVNEVMIKELKL